MDNENEKLPFSEGAERAVLGKALEDTLLFSEIAGEVAVEDFYFYDHKAIFQAMLDLSSVKFNISSLANRLAEMGELDKIGGINTLETLLLESPTTSDVSAFCETIRSTSVRRKLIKAAGKIHDIAINPLGLKAEEILDKVEENIFQIGSKYREGKQLGIQPITTYTAQAISVIEERKKLGANALLGYPTGLKKLDEMTQGLNRGDLIILAARPSMGKTALALNMAWSVSQKTNLPILIFSLEMPGNLLATRFISSISGLSQQDLRNGIVADSSRFKVATTKLYNSKIFIDDNGGISLQDIRSEARKLKQDLGEIGLIVLDYLQLVNLADNNANNNRSSMLGDLSRGLKLLARELNVPILALSQLNRSVDSRPDKRPLMSDLRESGAIEQDADLILFIYRKYVYTKKLEDKNKSEIIIGKQRNGPIDKLNVRFNGDISTFSDEVAGTESQDNEDEEDGSFLETRV